MTNPIKIPRREVAQEFYANVIALGKMALDNYHAEVKAGLREMNFNEVFEMRQHIRTLEAELEKYK